MANIDTIDHNINKVGGELTVEIRVRVGTGFKIKVWIATQLIKIVGRLLGTESTNINLITDKDIEETRFPKQGE